MEQEKVNRELFDSVRTGNIKLVESVLSKGADVNAKDNSFRTPLLWATIDNDKNMAEFLISKGAEIEAKDQAQRTPLHWAAINGFKNMAQMLISKGARVNAQTRTGNTPLYLASYNGYLDIVKLLLKNKAEINTQNQLGWTPLHAASHESYKDNVKLPPELDTSKLFFARKIKPDVARDYIGTAELLLRAGANKHIKENAGKTAADVAGKPEMRQLINNYN